MTAEPGWLTIEMTLAFQDEQLALFGGGQGLRDPGLLESALARARNRHEYEEDTNIFRLAAAYCAGIVKNHPFIDGNKRTGLLSLSVFLALNGYAFAPNRMDTVKVILGLASGEVEEPGLARWIEANAKPA